MVSRHGPLEGHKYSRGYEPPRRYDRRSYDAAALNRHTENHFLLADGRDADSLIRTDLATLRNRARYEIRNNSYAKGITETKANDTVGTGPRLQVISADSDFNRECEERWSEWCDVCDLQGRMTFAEIVKLAGSLQQDDSGESITIMQSLPRGARKAGYSRAYEAPALRLHVVEPDRMPLDYSVTGLAAPMGAGGKVRDGIETDDYGRPLNYYILKSHPGSDRPGFAGLAVGDYNIVPADHVIHLYRHERPGQSRGVPWLTPAIPLFAYLRRFTLATISAAEWAANVSAVLSQEITDPEQIEDKVTAMDEIEIARNALLTIPSNSKMEQFKSEHPATTYGEFKAEILNEIARCLNMPYNVAAANSAKYNYASGRLDWQVYFRSIRTVRGWIERHFTNRVFRAWLREAALIPGYFKRPMPKALDQQWFWPGSEHVDPQKEAKAQQLRLQSGTTTYAAEFAAQGKDWEKQIKQRSVEQKLLTKLGLTGAPAAGPPEPREDDDEDKKDEEEKGDE